MDSISNCCILSFDVGNYVTGKAVESFTLVVEADLLADVPSYLLEVNLLFGYSSLS